MEQAKPLKDVAKILIVDDAEVNRRLKMAVNEQLRQLEWRRKMSCTP